MACDIWWHYSKPVGSIGQYLVTEELIPDSSGLWHYLLGWGIVVYQIPSLQLAHNIAKLLI